MKNKFSIQENSYLWNAGKSSARSFAKQNDESRSTSPFRGCVVHNTEDLYNRSCAESNILKSLIMSRNTDDGKKKKPNLDDIIIHDYQMANSITMNSILSNFVVDIDNVANGIGNGIGGNEVFKVVSLDEGADGETSLLLKLKDGYGAFYQGGLELGADVLSTPQGTTKFVNLGGIWYGIILNQTVHNIENDSPYDKGGSNDSIRYQSGANPLDSDDHSWETSILYDQLDVPKEMNLTTSSQVKYLNGRNPFGVKLYVVDANGNYKPSEYASFNEYMRKNAVSTKVQQTINSMAENPLHLNNFGISEIDDMDYCLAVQLRKSNYIVCTSNGLYGIELVSDDDGKFDHIVMHDIGTKIPSIVSSRGVYSDFEFIYCGICTIEENATLFIICVGKNDGKSHYFYVNEDTMDLLYGLNVANQCAVDGMVFASDDIFTKIDSIKGLDTMSIAMTDYGFWDIEPNKTSDVVYSYRGIKNGMFRANVNANKLNDKSVLPIDVVGDDDKVSECGILWKLHEDSYVNESNGMKYPHELPTMGRFVGASKSFAAYSNQNGGLSLMARIDEIQLKKLVFGDDSIGRTFIQWLFTTATGTETPVERWLEQKHSSFLTSLNSIVGEKPWKFNVTEKFSELCSDLFGSRRLMDIVGGQNNLQSYCQALFNLSGIYGFVGQSEIEARISELFGENWRKDEIGTVVQEIIDRLVKEHPQLEWFRQYLKLHLMSDYQDVEYVVSILNSDELGKELSDAIRLLAPAPLTIGGYSSGKYYGLDAYIPNNKMQVQLDKVQDVVSISNEISIVKESVSSIPFFAEHLTYDALNSHKNDSNLFKVGCHSDFVKRALYLVDGNGNINVNWNPLKNWLFNPSNIQESEILKAFVRTQLYRPLHFKSDNYATFTDDESAYSCSTRKSYIDHLGIERTLKFNNGNYSSIDLTSSGFSAVIDKYSFHNVVYDISTNRLSYEIRTPKIDVVDGKFIYNDVQHFVDFNGTDVKTLWFNEFNSALDVDENSVEIVDGQFSIDGVDFSYDGSELQVILTDSDGNKILEGKETYVKQLDSTERFNFNGKEYAIVGGYVVNSDVIDNKLVELSVSDNKADYKNLEYIFSVNDGELSVTVVKFIDTSIIDRIISEFCEYDGADIEITTDKTFEWHLANKIVDMGDSISAFNGVLFNGNLDSECQLDFEHKVNGGDVVTNAVIKFSDGGNTTQSLGTVLNNKLNAVVGKVLYGKMDSSNLIELGDESSSDVFIVKNGADGQNNVNSVKLSASDWKEITSVAEVGKGVVSESDEITFKMKSYYGEVIEDDNAEEGEEGGEEGGSEEGEIPDDAVEIEYNNFKLLTLIPSGAIDENNPYAEKYIVRTSDDGIGDYVVNRRENLINFVAKPVSSTKEFRYVLDLQTMALSRLEQLHTVNASTLDFSTENNYENLKENLTQSLKQTALTEIEEAILLVSQPSNEPIAVHKDTDFNLFLDLSSDELNASNYKILNSDFSSDDESKFREIYKNSSFTIGESKIGEGLVKKFMDKVVSDMFKGSKTITLNGEPSFKASRVGGVDVFGYSTYIDIVATATRADVKSKFAESNGDRFAVGTLTLKNVEIESKFVPKFNPSTSKITCEVSFNVKGGSVEAVCSQIYYSIDGKVKSKFLDDENKISKEVAIGSNTVTYGEFDVSEMSDESVSLFSSDAISTLFDGNFIDGIASSFSSAIPQSMVVGTRQIKHNWTRLESEPPSDAVWTSNGLAIVDGQRFKVSQFGNRLEPIDGNEGYDIEMVENEYLIVWDAPIVSKDYLENHFDFKYDSSNRIAVPKDDVMQITSTPTTLNSQVGFMYTRTESDIMLGPSMVADTAEMFNTTFALGESETARQTFDISYGVSGETVGHFTVVASTTERIVSLQEKDASGEMVGDEITDSVAIQSLVDEYESFEALEEHYVVETIEEFNLSFDESSVVQYYSIDGTNADIKGVKTVTPIGIEFNIEDVMSEDEELDDGTIQTTYEVQFKLKAHMVEGLFAAKKPTPYFNANYGVYVDPESGIKTIIVLKSMVGSSAGGKPYGFMMCPVNLDADGITYGNLKYENIYIKFNNNVLDSDGKNAPYMMKVLNYDEERVNDWDIYDRYYVTETQIYASILKDFNFKIDGVQTRSSERARQIGSMDYSALPDKMVEGLDRLRLEALSMDKKWYSESNLRFSQYLRLIEEQLTQMVNLEDLFGDSSINAESSVVLPMHHSTVWNDADGLFGFESDTLGTCIYNFESHLFNEFYNDFSAIDDSNVVRGSQEYWEVMPQSISPLHISKTKNGKLKSILDEIFNGYEEYSDIEEVFGVEKYPNVKEISVFKTSMKSGFKELHICGGYCNVFQNAVDKQIIWWRFNSSSEYISSVIEKKAVGSLTEISIDKILVNGSIVEIDGWCFRYGNRDMNVDSPSASGCPIVRINDGDTFFIQDVGTVKAINGKEDRIKDLAYVSLNGRVYAIYEGDTRVYAYDGLESNLNSEGIASISKSTASMVIDTFQSSAIMNGGVNELERIYVDYNKGYWKIRLFGKLLGGIYEEVWDDNPGISESRFSIHNSIIFGDSLFTEQQLQFHNVSKNKEMLDILDVDEIDGRYYGLFADKNSSSDGNMAYSIFRTNDSDSRIGGVVEMLPFKVVMPTLLRSADSLYSLYVLIEDENGKKCLHEISVPNSPIYAHRRIDIEDIIGKETDLGDDGIEITQVMMHQFRCGRKDSGNSKMFVLSNVGFHQIGYSDTNTPVTIDSADDLTEAVGNAITENVIKKHMEEEHYGNKFFKTISEKVNQYADGFNVFDVIPTEFGATQDVGVVPDSKVDDDDEVEDHNVDSVVANTDIVIGKDGMALGSDSNPGMVAIAVSSPATTYEDDTIIGKSQRNPSIDGTEFYDYIYRQSTMETLLDGYAIPFIYRVNSNNTYDLYINIPTTRTKYLNRVACTLKDDGTTLVNGSDVRTRPNFASAEDEPIPNSLDSETTRIRVFIDRKYISVGDV